MVLLERVGQECISTITPHVVRVQYVHAFRAVEAAQRFEDTEKYLFTLAARFFTLDVSVVKRIT